MKVALSTCALLLTFGAAVAQETATPNDIADRRSEAYALTHATIHTDPDTMIENATLLIRDGQVVSVTAGGSVPTGYVTVDASDRHVYPGLIDIYTGYGLPEPPQPAPFQWGAAEVLESQTPGAFNVNQAIRSEYAAARHFTADPEAAKSFRSMGFGAVLTFMADGIARGSGALVSLGRGSDNELVLEPAAAALYSFHKGSSPQSYPISPMGSIALLRQTHLDAQWLAAQQPRPFTDNSLEAWNAHQSLPQIFEAGDWLSALRADEVGDELKVQYIIKGAGDEYRRAEALKATGAAFIIPLNFPEPKDVEDPLDARMVSWVDLKHWELAPTNPAVLESAGIDFALTSGGDKDNFWKNLRRAIELGLSERTALAALTTQPAAMLGASDRLGRIAAGQRANFLITSGPLFDEETVIEDNWIDGQRFQVNEPVEDRSGAYRVQVADSEYRLEVSGKPRQPKAKIVAADAPDDAGKNEAKLKFDDRLVTLSFDPREEVDGAVRLSGWMTEDGWSGRGQLEDGRWVSWSAARSGDLPEDDDGNGKEEDETDTAVGELVYPFAAYGRSTLPRPETVLIRKATVWSLEDDGILENGDVLIRDGKIAAVGAGLSSADATVIDAEGMHVTPGIIDEHSHIALSGVNDVATNSGMVRMNDVVDSEDVNIYRNLAGGVVAAQLLHGSANPIGGQSALVKMRWGHLPREMLIEDADGFIKFALGENVKRSRSPQSIRYPQSRMGVEQVYRDAFTRARDYADEWAAWNGLSGRAKRDASPPRRDLALDTMLEIMNGERFVTSHSYVQSEINMLMHVAEDFGFNINTFTHILEGYKVADKMAAHGAGGSTFADWWAYKWEVRYAIPYNAALMTEAGVTTAVNSDSGEMSRRLNQEAAKAVKYGGLSEVEALKLVTLNPARLLHLDDRMGSIAVGKDADIVIWTDHPLSIAARADKTFVDGIRYFDREEDRRMRQRISQERARLTAEMMAAKKNGGSNGKPNGGKPQKKPERLWQCDSLHGYEYLGLSSH